MFILGYFFSSLALLFSIFFRILYFLLVVRIILSWFQVSSYSELANILYRITDPILIPFRRLPLQVGMIDFSPILAFFALAFLDHFLVGILRQLAYQMGAVA